jgi:Cytosol aminopeptidase family, N-terminal domain
MLPTLQRCVYGGSLTRRFYFLALISTTTACAVPSPGAAAPSSTPNASVALPAGEPAFAAIAVSPLTQETPLQIVSIFAYEAGETLVSPATELARFVAKPRQDAAFGKEPLRTLLLSPAPAPTKAKSLLYVALGPRAEFSFERVRSVGGTAMRETLKMRVEHMAFAPIVRDQGVTTFAADDVAQAFVEGALVEFGNERRAAPASDFALRDVTYEAGPQFVESVSTAVARGVAAAHTELASRH